MNVIGLNDFNQEEYLDIFSLNMIYISLCSLWSGSTLARKVKISFGIKDKHECNYAIYTSIYEKPAMFLYWLTFPFYMYNIFIENSFVSEYGYLEYYKSFAGAGKIVSYGNIVCIFSFYLFLACFPTKRKVIPVIISYLFANILSIFSGGRTSMVVAMTFSLFYFLLRQGRDDDSTWLKKSHIVILIIIFPLLLAFLGYWAYYRTGTIQSEMSLGNYILSFIEANGGSGSIIGYTYKLKKILKALGSHTYSFGFLVRLFCGINYGQSTVELAKSGTSLGAALTYLLKPYMFLNGGGLGTCYIAELWIDFGVIGVIVYNIIIGYILSKMSRINFMHTIRALISFIVIQDLFILPRSEVLCMLPFFTSRIFIILLILTLVIRNCSQKIMQIK